MRLPTASSLWLADACPASHVLPWSRRVSADMSRGTAVHEFLQSAPAGRDQALAKVPENHRSLCEQIDVRIIPDGDREIAYGYDVESGSVARIGEIPHRSYPTMPGRWVYGTADVVAPGPTILDYKVTDVDIDAHALAIPSGKSHQLRFLAMVAAKNSGAIGALIGHIKIRSDGTLDDSDQAVLGPFDLLAIEDQVRKIVEKVDRAAERPNPDLTPGDHCQFCPAAHQCPATTALLRDFFTESDSQKNLWDAWKWIRRAQAAIRFLDEEIRHAARLAPIPLGNGREVREVEEERRSYDAAVTLGALRDAGYNPRGWLSKADVERVTGPGAPLRSMITEIRARGGEKVETLRVVRETKVKPAQMQTTATEEPGPLDFLVLI